MTSKPLVQVNDRDFHELTRDVVDALVEVNSDDPRLFTLGSTLTRLGHTGGTRLIPVDTNGLRNETRGIEFVRVQVNNDGKSTKSGSPPMGVLANILAEPAWPFPPIERVVHVPVFAADGTVMTTPGFHKASLTYFAPLAGVTMESLPGKVEPPHLELAAYWLNELLGDFPFRSASDRAHAIAAMILPLVRNLINGPTPLHLISAPTPGTGKTLLAKAISIPAVGPHVGTMTQARDDEEWRKKIGAALSGGPMVVLWDNVSGWVGSPQLNAVLTAVVWQDRRLGKNDEELHLPNRALWVMTSNNADVSEEVARRAVPIRLDAQTERPSDRPPSTFKYPYIDQWASEHRDKLIWSALVMGQAWVEAGRPPGRRSLGSFESWASVIGGILEVAGVDGFLGNIDEFRAEFSQEQHQWAEFLAAWHAEHGDRPLRVKEILEVYRPGDDFLNIGTNPRFKASRSEQTTMGWRLKKNRYAVYGGFRLEPAGTQQRGNLWKVVPVNPAGGG